MKNKHLQKVFLVITASVFCYLNTLGGTFVFDDTEAVLKNKDLDPNGSYINIFQNDFWGTRITSNTSHKSYRPLTILFYKTIVNLSGSYEPFWFHATNIVLYSLLCVSFYLVVVTIIPIEDAAILASILYSVHPLHSEVVSSIVGQADLLCSFTFFIGLYFYQKATNSFVYLSCTIMLALVSMLCKETGITLLGVCSLYDIVKSDRSKIDLKFSLRQISLGLATIVLLYGRLYVMDFNGPTFQPMDNPASFADHFFTRVMSYCYNHSLNLLLLVWPEWLCFDWSMGCVPLIESVNDFRIVFVVLFYFLFITFILTQILRKSKPFMYSLTLLTIPFLPASNILLSVGFVIAERTLLLPSAGFCLLITLGYLRLHKLNPKFKAFFWGLCIIFALRTRQRAGEWINEEALFNSALSVCPLNAKVHYNVAKLAVDNGDLVKAETEYRKAILLHPNYDQAMNNLANLLRDKNELEEAKQLLHRAIEIRYLSVFDSVFHLYERYDFSAAWMNLGIVLATLDDHENSEMAYKTALQYRKNYADCFYNLGNLYLKLDKTEDAQKMWMKATEIKISHTAAWSNLLVLLDTLGKWNEAVTLGHLALNANPNVAALYFTLANTLGKLKRWEEAEQKFLIAINLNPKNALYHSNLGVLYHRWGKLHKAKRSYEEALKLNPNLQSTITNLKRLRQ